MTDSLAPLRDVESAIDRLTLRERPADAPLPTRASFQEILVGTDGSPRSDRALAWATVIAQAYGSHVHLVTALGPPTFDHGLSGNSTPTGGTLASWQTLMESERQSATEILDAGKERLARAGVQATSEILIGSVVARLTQTAESRKADLLIVGSDDLNALERLILGSVTSGVRHESPCSVLVTRNEPPVEKVLLATDGSAYSRSAVATGLRLARALEAGSEVLHVVPPPRHAASGRSREAYEEARDAVRDRDATIAAARDDPSVRYEVAFGEPAEILLDRTRAEGFGLLVLGTRGLGGLRSRLAGSVSEPVSRKAPCSVLLYKEAPR